jgi:hypothetical protein
MYWEEERAVHAWLESKASDLIEIAKAGPVAEVDADDDDGLEVPTLGEVGVEAEAEAEAGVEADFRFELLRVGKAVAVMLEVELQAAVVVAVAVAVWFSPAMQATLWKSAADSQHCSPLALGLVQTATHHGDAGVGVGVLDKAYQQPRRTGKARVGKETTLLAKGEVWA